MVGTGGMGWGGMRCEIFCLSKRLFLLALAAARPGGAVCLISFVGHETVVSGGPVWGTTKMESRV